MKLLLWSLLAALTPIHMMADTFAELEQQRWVHRIILYTVAAKDQNRLDQQLEQQKDAVRDRDLVFVQLDGDDDSNRPLHLELDTAAIHRLAKQLDTQSGRTELILVGKDGGVKERIDRIDLQYLFDVIDSMPMRRAEMRSGSD